ncbi:YCF48-related protein [Curvibacter sp. HBC61]|uniref:YCF48-related protein n=1 Tax=Curvibacter cyanobacteriorum TaxID=3026422 RepID=A0ABT5MXU6_9BURK|nr:YCF48-related protein [Curvibacter sp. HBC61]MDD0838878.1 YCF48-related protein [Curvibacter sp. HBC61]
MTAPADALTVPHRPRRPTGPASPGTAFPPADLAGSVPARRVRPAAASLADLLAAFVALPFRWCRAALLATPTPVPVCASRRGALRWGAALGGLLGVAQAAPVVDSLDRPALATRLGPNSVLLAAAQAGPHTVVVGERGLVLWSPDQARTWHQAQVPVSVTLTAVRFESERRGIAVGHGGVVLSTQDGGQSWQQRLNGRQMAQALLSEARARQHAGAIAQAERLVQDGADKPLLDVAWVAPQRVLVVGAFGLAWASEDGGLNWAPWTERLDNPKGLHLYAVRHHGAALLLAGEQGLLLYSSDAGRRFQRLPSPYQGSFFTAEMLSPTEFVVAGLRGQIWHTQDAGQHWQPVHNPVHASITGSAQGADGQLWWVNQAGLVLQQRQGALQPVPGKPQAPLSGVLPLAGGSLLTVGLQGLRLQTVAPASAAAAAPGAQP